MGWRKGGKSEGRVSKRENGVKDGKKDQLGVIGGEGGMGWRLWKQT